MLPRTQVIQFTINCSHIYFLTVCYYFLYSFSHLVDAVFSNIMEDCYFYIYIPNLSKGIHILITSCLCETMEQMANHIFTCFLEHHMNIVSEWVLWMQVYC